MADNTYGYTPDQIATITQSFKNSFGNFGGGNLGWGWGFGAPSAAKALIAEYGSADKIPQAMKMVLTDEFISGGTQEQAADAIKKYQKDPTALYKKAIGLEAKAMGWESGVSSYYPSSKIDPSQRQQTIQNLINEAVSSGSLDFTQAKNIASDAYNAEFQHYGNIMNPQESGFGANLVNKIGGAITSNPLSTLTFPLVAAGLTTPEVLAGSKAVETIASGGNIADALKSAGTSYAAGQAGGSVGGTVASETGSNALGNIAGGAAVGGTGAALSGGNIGTGLLAGATGGAINAGINTLVDTGSNLLSGTTPTTTEVPQMIEQQINDYLTQTAPVDYGVNSWTGTDITSTPYIDALMPTTPVTPTTDLITNATTPTTGTTGMDDTLDFTNMTDAQINDYLYNAAPVDYGTNTWTGADTTAADMAAINDAVASSGLNSNAITNLLKQFGTSAVKSLLGIGGAAGTTGGTGAGTTAGGLLGAGVNYALSANQINQLQNAYAQNVAQQQAATKLAQQQASFTPVGVTTAFGQSQFQVDPTTGKLVSAGYTASPALAAQREKLFSLGSAALPSTADTSQIQANYIAQQQGLLAPGREQQLAQLRNRQYQRGTTGLATGGTVAGYAPNAQGLMATNPEMAAYYNSLAQQDAQLAANAPTYAQNLLNSQIATGTGLFGAANTLEGYAQQPLTLGVGLGTQASAAGAKAGQLGLLGGQSALSTGLQGQLAGIYGQGQALSTAVNPLVTAAQQGLSNVIGNWLS